MIYQLQTPCKTSGSQCMVLGRYVKMIPFLHNVQPSRNMVRGAQFLYVLMHMRTPFRENKQCSLVKSSHFPPLKFIFHFVLLSNFYQGRHRFVKSGLCAISWRRIIK